MKTSSSITRRRNLKVAIVVANLRNRDVAFQANRFLSESFRLSEMDITKLLTCRKAATPEQAEAIARVLGQPSQQLFE